MRTPRILIYAALALGSVLFAFPLAWLVLTSFKPIEQTMAFPPVWIPRAWYAEIDGRRMEVTRDFQLRQPTILAEVSPADGSEPRRVLLPPDSPELADPGTRILARGEPGWWRVTERSETKTVTRSLAWTILPPSEIDGRLALRWENYPKALATIGGRSIEEIEGAVSRVGSGPDAEVTFSTFLRNTVIVCVLGVAGTVLSNAIVAYGFARLRWRGRDAFFAVTLATMMVPFPVLMVPLYGIFKELGWIGSLLPLWVPAFFGSAFNIFLMRQFFRTIPEELSEAARIDGCSEWMIFWRIILPLSRPVLAVVALFHFLYAWNDFLGPLLYLTRKQTFTLALALQNYQSQQGGVQWHFLMAASAVTVLPIILLFFFAQKTFIQGIATTGSKG